MSTWLELVAALHDAALVPATPNSGGHRRSNFVFRGMSDASWTVQSSLQRLGAHGKDVERPLLRNFRKYTPPGLGSTGSEWETLALAQHNGLPTRCVDWTFSPLVAAHFATVATSHRGADGVVWCFDVVRWRDQILPLHLRAQLHGLRAWIYDVRALEDAFPTLEDLDRAFPDAPGIVMFEPPSIDARIANQGGILSVVGGDAFAHQAALMSAERAQPGVVRRVVIDASAKAEIRDMLDQGNVTERMLFPGLPGLCDWLRRYYGPP